MNYSTKNDKMKQFMIDKDFGTELAGEYGIPMLPEVQETPTDMLDFKTINARSYNGTYKGKTVNFYIADCDFEQVWNKPDDYIDKLKCCQSVIAPDFTIDVSADGLPNALNIYNHYRNHAVAWYWHTRGIKIIPNVNIISPKYAPWIWHGIPRHSTLACSTNGRVKSKAARLEFCNTFTEMCDSLQPTKVIIVGHEIPELITYTPICYYDSRNQMINKQRFNE